MHKYPRTQHIEGSRLQPGDEDLSAVPLSQLAGRYLVVEEKMDGANCGVSVNDDGNGDGDLLLQSRGHYLNGGAREKHFALFKQWASAHQTVLRDVLGERYVMYGEWLYAKHTIFYDNLPHYLMEFDLLDRETNAFLDTPSRREILKPIPVPPVKVLFQGVAKSLEELTNHISRSRFIRDNHLQTLKQQCDRLNVDSERALRETDRTNLMEGLYIKVEENGRVQARYKFVRASFLTAVQKADGHWLHRPIIPNLLAQDVRLW